MPISRFKRLEPQKWDRIASAVLGEFFKYGFLNASYNRIIKGSGLSKGTMYYYFDSKDELLRVVISELLSVFHLPQSSTSFSDEAPLYWREVWGWVDWLFESCSQDHQAQLLCKNILKISRQSQDHPLAFLVERVDDWLEDRIVNGQACGAIRRDLPIEVLVELCWGIWRTVGVWLLAGQPISGSVSRKETVDTVIDSLRRNLEPRVLIAQT